MFAVRLDMEEERVSIKEWEYFVRQINEGLGLSMDMDGIS